MSSSLFKALSFNNYNPNDATNNYANFRAAPYNDFSAGNTTAIVKFWIDWSLMTPDPAASGYPDPTTVQNGYLQQMQEQIRLARADNKYIILTFWRTPYWANGQTANGPQQCFVPPTDTSIYSPWVYYFRFLMNWFSRSSPFTSDWPYGNGGATVDLIEICNEPNLQWNPPNTPQSHAAKCAQMMKWAQYWQQYYKNNPNFQCMWTPIAAPGVADLPTINKTDPTKNTEGASSWLPRLFTELANIGFTANSDFTFTAHNYGGCTDQSGARTQNIRDILRAHNWGGWPGNSGQDPWLLLTEGGTTDVASAPGIVNATYNALHNDNDRRTAATRQAVEV